MIRKVAFLLCLTIVAKLTTASQPNIILIISDDNSWGEMGIMGNEQIHTPHLDKLYEKSLRFKNFHTAPTCAPARAQLMTGQHEFTVGVTHTIKAREQLRDDITILPQYLKQAGYQTSMFGKWHLSNKRTGLTGQPLDPHKRGFDTALWTYNQLKRFDPPLSLNGEMIQFEGYCADVIFDEAMKWMEGAEPSAPFFTYIATSIPHTPMGAPQEFEDLYKDTRLNQKQKQYYAMVSALDANVGRLMNWLDEQPFHEETILIFMTDNGHAIGGFAGAGHGKDGLLKNSGLYNVGRRGGKGQAWQGSTAVPFLIDWPGVTTAGDTHTLASAKDILPTFAAIAGLDIDNPNITGISLLNDIKGAPSRVPDDRILVTHRGRWPQSNEMDAYKHNYASIYDKEYRLVWGELGSGPELFHYTQDIGESENVIAEHPEIAERFIKRFDEWWDYVKPGMVNDLHQIKTGKFPRK